MTEPGRRRRDRVPDSERRQRGGSERLLRGGPVGIALTTIATAGLVAGAAVIAAVVSALS